MQAQAPMQEMENLPFLALALALEFVFAFAFHMCEPGKHKHKHKHKGEICTPKFTSNINSAYRRRRKKKIFIGDSSQGTSKY